MLTANLHIKFSKNNIIFNLTDQNGNCIFSVSSGSLGFKGTMKVSRMAVLSAMDVIVKKIIEIGITKIMIKAKGQNIYMNEINEILIKNEIQI